MKTPPRPAARKAKLLCFGVEKIKGRWEAKCPLGLWSVNSPSKEHAMREGLRYLFLYYEGGEYAALGHRPTGGSAHD